MTSLFSHPRTYSPAPWPPKVGELVVIRQKTVGDENGLNGFCAVVEYLNPLKPIVGVRLLDSEDKELKRFPLEELISTGKSPSELLAEFMPTDLEFSEALRIERSLPDFSLFKRTKKPGTKSPKAKKSEKELSPEQVSLLKKLIIAKLKEIKET